jgi:hypothetical protein
MIRNVYADQLVNQLNAKYGLDAWLVDLPDRFKHVLVAVNPDHDVRTIEIDSGDWAAVRHRLHRLIATVLMRNDKPRMSVPVLALSEDYPTDLPEK